MKITSIFRSIDGEVNGAGGQGQFTVFIRTWGCNLSCIYCDTPQGRDPKFCQEMSIDQVIQQVKDFDCPKVTITGGEPLLQMDSFVELCVRLKGIGKVISVETNGTIKPPQLGLVESYIMDWKLSSSGIEVGQMVLENFWDLRRCDFIKFVIGDRSDFDEACGVIRRVSGTGTLAAFAFSPMWGFVIPNTLYDWMEKGKLYQWGTYLNLQMHKVVWPKIGYGEER